MAACVLLLLVHSRCLAAGVALFEAEDRRFVTLKGDWEVLEQDEAREGGATAMASSSAGSTLRLDFTGRRLAGRLLNGEFERRTRVNARPALYAFRRFPAAVVKASVDGGRQSSIDMSGRSGWEDIVLADDLPPGRHAVVLELASGTLLVDRFVSSDAPMARVRATVLDECGVPVSDAAVEFRTKDGLAAALRAHRDGCTGVSCSVPPGTYTVTAVPDDGPGIDDVWEMVDDPRLPQVVDSIRLEPGRLTELAFRLPYRDRLARPCGAVIRPALGAPVIRTPGSSFPLTLRTDPGGPVEAALISAAGRIPIAVGAPAIGPDGAFRPVAIPASVAPGTYGLSVRIGRLTEDLPGVVTIVGSHPRSYRIAHVSDVHVKSLKHHWGAYNTLVGIAQDIAALEPRPGFAVITGDLTDSGVPSQYLRLRRALAAFEVPVYLCQGNHDCIDGAGDRSFRGAREYERFMGPDRFAEVLGQDRFAMLGTGYYETLGEDRSTWAVEALKGPGPGLRGLFFHFDYTCEIPPGGRAPSSEMSFLAGRAGANLLLFGHVHSQQVQRVGGAISFRAAAAVEGEYQLVEVRDGAPAGVQPRKPGRRGSDAPAATEPWARACPAADRSVEDKGLARAREIFESVFEASELAPDLANQEPRVRRAAAQRIASLGDSKGAREALEKALSDPDPLVREQAALAFAMDGRAGPLKKAAADPDPRVRAAALRAAAHARGKPGLEALMSLLKDPVEDNAELAALAIGEFRTKGVVEQIGGRLADRGIRARARVALVLALSEHDSEAASPHLEPLLKDADLQVRAEAAMVLGDWGSWKSVPELIRLTEEGLPRRQDDARRILKKITGKDFGAGSAKERERWEEWWEREGKTKGGD